MKKYFLQFLSFAIAAVVLIFTISAKEKKVDEVKKNQTAPNGFAVLELFTSQGCSSCPAADDLLGSYAMMKNEKIIPIAFHVDYWNRLGWKDSFSSAAFTERQRTYSTLISNSSVYTPQLVINGSKEMVGSDKSNIQSSINNELQKKAAVKIDIIKIENKAGKIAVTYAAAGELERMKLVAVLVQNKIVTSIRSGENKGVALANYDVVTNLVSGRIEKQGNYDLVFPAYFLAKDFSVVLFAQNNETGEIAGAVKKAL